VTHRTSFNRRRFLQGSAVGLGALAAPAIISSKALASSGELNFVGWAGYPGLTEKAFPAFEAATGIKVNYKEVPDQDTMFGEAKVALQTGSADIMEPTIDRVSAWNSNGLIAPWDESKLELGNYLPGLIDGNAEGMARIDGRLMIAPTNWGTESMVVHSEDARLSDPPSLGDLFNPENPAVLRPHSALAAMGRWLDAQGKLPRPFIDSYSDMEAMVQIWDIALAEAIKMKGNVVQWWTGENDANAGFTANGATVGLCWDSTGYNLRNEGYAYVAPVEGAFAWNQGLFLMKNATNTEQAHELAKFISTPEGSAIWATAFSSNPVSQGGYALLGPEVAEYYGGFLTAETSANLWWWPPQSAEFIAKRTEYADKYKAA
jgi:spermidine/putrescine transport system substrate-binding protein